MKIYVGSLSYDVTKEDLQTEFATYGTVGSVSVPLVPARMIEAVVVVTAGEDQEVMAGIEGAIIKK